MDQKININLPDNGNVVTKQKKILFQQKITFFV